MKKEIEENTKNLKAYCAKTGRCFGLELRLFGGEWKVVNMVDISKEVFDSINSEISLPRFLTNDNLIPCRQCGSRVVGGCSCPRCSRRCGKEMPYCFDCIYCDQFRIDYTPAKAPSAGADVKAGRDGSNIRFNPVTFENKGWKTFDRISVHPSGARYNEPSEHVTFKDKDIEFHGYNVSAMDEGVRYDIGANDCFEIECSVDTSTIQPHPGGHLYISCGNLTAEISGRGGVFFFGGKKVGKVESRFIMKLSVAYGSHYELHLDEKKIGEWDERSGRSLGIIFGFKHGRHNCERLSHAYLRNIRMVHGQQTR